MRPLPVAAGTPAPTSGSGAAAGSKSPAGHRSRFRTKGQKQRQQQAHCVWPPGLETCGQLVHAAGMRTLRGGEGMGPLQRATTAAVALPVRARARVK